MSDIAEIHKICKEIQSLHVIIYNARCDRLLSRVSVISEILSKSQKSHPPQVLTLLRVTLEDIRNFMKQLLSKSKALAISVLKFGTHEENFVKLNEQLEHCAILLGGVAMVKVVDAEDIADFNADLRHLKKELPSLLAEIGLKRNRDKRHSLAPYLNQYLITTTQLIENQLRIRGSYRSKRHPTEDLSISGSDLEFLKAVGRGGFATVWLGRYKKEQEVAIKILNIEASDSTVEDFKNEAEIMRRMVHRNITTCYGIAETERGYCMVMEYLANDSLFTYMKVNRDNVPSWSRKIDFALDIARGVAFLHRLGIIHRDLKVSNILLDSLYRGKIADFGLSHIKTSQTSIVHLQEAGTVTYMAPETFGANASYSTRSDIYAFGMMLWGISHWDQPFKGIVREEVREMVWKERYRPEIDSSVPKAVQSVITLAWTQNASNRPPMIEIESFLAGLVFIDGLERENDILDTDMSTTVMVSPMSPAPLTVKLIPATQPKVAQKPPMSQKVNGNENFPVVDLDTNIKQLKPPYEIPKPIKAIKRRFSRNIMIVIGILALLLCGVVVVLMVVLSQRSSEQPLQFPDESTTALSITGLVSAASIKRSASASRLVVASPTSSISTFSPSPTCKISNYTIATLNGSSSILSNPLDPTSLIRTVRSPTGISKTFSGDLIISESTGSALLFYNMSSRRLSPINIGNGPYTSDGGGGLRIFLYPLAPQVAVSNDGAIYLTSGSAILKLINNDLILVAGGDGSTFAMDGYVGTSSLGENANLIMNGSNVIVFDRQNNMIRKLNSSNYLSTLSGSSSSGTMNGALSVARFNNPTNGAFDKNGNLFVSDTGNNQIRKITPLGVVSLHFQGSILSSPGGLVVDPCGNMIVISQTDGGSLVIIRPNLISTYFGGLSQNGISNIVQGNDGSLYIPDSAANSIKKFTFY